MDTSNNLDVLLMDLIDDAVLQIITYGSEEKFDTYLDFIKHKVNAIKSNPSKLNDIGFIIPVTKAPFLNEHANIKNEMNIAVNDSLQKNNAHSIIDMLNNVNYATDKAMESIPNNLENKKDEMKSFVSKMLISSIINESGKQLYDIDNFKCDVKIISNPNCPCVICKQKNKNNSFDDIPDSIPSNHIEYENSEEIDDDMPTLEPSSHHTNSKKIKDPYNVPDIVSYLDPYSSNGKATNFDNVLFEKFASSVLNDLFTNANLNDYKPTIKDLLDLLATSQSKEQHENKNDSDEKKENESSLQGDCSFNISI